MGCQSQHGQLSRLRCTTDPQPRPADGPVGSSERSPAPLETPPCSARSPGGQLRVPGSQQCHQHHAAPVPAALTWVPAAALPHPCAAAPAPVRPGEPAPASPPTKITGQAAVPEGKSFSGEMVLLPLCYQLRHSQILLTQMKT